MSKNKRRKGKPIFKLPRFLRRKFPKVEDVTDARKAIRVSVKPADCAAGKAKQPTECALAKAVKRQYQAEGAIIGMSFSYIIRGTKAVRFKTPTSVAREIVSFDRHKDFAPGEYGLSPVSPSNRIGAQSGRPRTKEHVESRIIHRGTVRVREIDRGSV